MWGPEAIVQSRNYDWNLCVVNVFCKFRLGGGCRLWSLEPDDLIRDPQLSAIFHAIRRRCILILLIWSLSSPSVVLKVEDERKRVLINLLCIRYLRWKNDMKGTITSIRALSEFSHVMWVYRKSRNAGACDCETVAAIANAKLGSMFTI